MVAAVNPARRSKVAGALGAAVALATHWAVRRVEVRGDSMWPTLADGDRLLAVRKRHPKTGDLVVVPDPRQATRLVVKRVVAVHGRLVTLAGDNQAASTDSRTYGPVDRRRIVGRVVRRYGPAGRSGPVS